MANRPAFDTLHQQAMGLVDDADELLRQSRHAEGHAKFAEAAEAEELAVSWTPKDRPRTIGILRRSAVSLWQLAGNPEKAASLAGEYLKEPSLPGFDREMEYTRRDLLSLVASRQKGG